MMVSERLKMILKLKVNACCFDFFLLFSKDEFEFETSNRQVKFFVVQDDNEEILSRNSR